MFRTSIFVQKDTLSMKDSVQKCIALELQGKEGSSSLKHQWKSLKYYNCIGRPLE